MFCPANSKLPPWFRKNQPNPKPSGEPFRVALLNALGTGIAQKNRRCGPAGKGEETNLDASKPYGLFGVAVGNGEVRPGICKTVPGFWTTGCEFDGGLPIGTGWRIIVDFVAPPDAAADGSGRWMRGVIKKSISLVLRVTPLRLKRFPRIGMTPNCFP